DGFNRRAQPAAGVDVLEADAERVDGAIYIVPTSKRLRSNHAWPTRYTFADLIGSSAPLKECIRSADLAATEDWPVLLVGESGTGKELLAHAIHAAGPRSSGPFVTFNCAGVTDDLVASELFGYDAGTFTGAAKE